MPKSSKVPAENPKKPLGVLIFAYGAVVALILGLMSFMLTLPTSSGK
jgi:hypothetical protein